jgi:hypothetical protein
VHPSENRCKRLRQSGVEVFKMRARSSSVEVKEPRLSKRRTRMLRTANRTTMARGKGPRREAISEVVALIAKRGLKKTEEQLVTAAE